MNTDRPNQESSATSDRHWRGKRFGLKELLIFTYLSPVGILPIYYLAPQWAWGLIAAAALILSAGLVIGTLGIVITLITSAAVWAFSSKSAKEKRRDQFVLIKMLTAFLGVIVGPLLIAVGLIIGLEWLSSLLARIFL